MIRRAFGNVRAPHAGQALGTAASLVRLRLLGKSNHRDAGGQCRIHSMQAGKYARYEFERRFLVRRLPPGLGTAPGFRILDRYLTGTRLRLRRMEPLDDGEPVLKLGQKQTPNAADATTAVITTIYLSQAEYDALAGLAGDELAKIRHGVDDGGRSWS